MGHARQMGNRPTMRLLLLILAEVGALSVGASPLDRIFPTDINVRDHGAKGDGVTDDTAAIQAAASEAAACAEKMRRKVGTRNCAENLVQADGPVPRIVFPAGTYLVSAPVFFYRDSQVYGMGEVTVRATKGDIDLFVITQAYRNYMQGVTLEGGARQVLIESYNNESANITLRDCVFRRAQRAAVDCHTWQLPQSGTRPRQEMVGTYRWNSVTGRYEKDPRMESPDLTGWANSTLLTVESCRFEDCQLVSDTTPDGALFRDLKVTTSVSTSCVFRVGCNFHAYGLDVTVKRPGGAGHLAVFESLRVRSMIEDSTFTTPDAVGVALVRTAAAKGGYTSGSIILRNLKVACAGCPEGGIIVCPNRRTMEFLSLTDVTDTTGRMVKAIVFPDGMDEADYTAFRYFDVANDRTFSIVLGRNSRNVDEGLPKVPNRFRIAGEHLVPEPVRSLKVPHIAMKGEVLWGPAYGVGITGVGDDTAAMKRLFAVAAERPGSVVVLPPRRIVLRETIEVANRVDVTSPGVAMVETEDDELTLFRIADGAVVSFSNIHFEQGGTHVSCQVEKGATVAIDRCRSFDAKNVAFRMETRGEPDGLRVLVNGGVHYAPVWYVGNAQVTLSDAWLRILPPVPHTECFTESRAIVNRGRMRLQDILGVPCVFAGHPMDSFGKDIPNGDYRWIDNCGGVLHSLFVRYGGEWGGIPPVYNYDGGKVLIEGNVAYFYPRHTAHQMIVNHGKPSDLQAYGVSCGFEMLTWHGGLKFLQRQADGSFEPISNARVHGNIPR